MTAKFTSDVSEAFQIEQAVLKWDPFEQCWFQNTSLKLLYKQREPGKNCVG